MDQQTNLSAHIATTLSQEAVRLGIIRLTPNDLKYLHIMAKKFQYDLGVSKDQRVEPGDLVNMAIELTLSCSRRCPADVDFMTFLIGVIRSCASNQRELADNKNASLDAALENDAPMLSGLIDTVSNPESVLTRADELEKRVSGLIAAMGDDQEAITYLRAKLQDWDNPEILQKLGFDAKKLEAIQTRIRRRLFPVKGGRK